MKKSSISVVILGMLFTSCSSHLAVMQQDKHDTSLALDEIRVELADLKHALNNTQVELQILDEEVKNQDTTALKAKNGSSSLAANDPRIAALEKRLSLIEQKQDKVASEINQLTSHANQTSQSLSQYKSKIHELENSIHDQNKKIEDVVQLKSTLQSLTHAIGSSTSQPSSYKVKPGDSLEKIARAHKTTVEALKKENNLTQNKILIGQELKLPSQGQ